MPLEIRGTWRSSSPAEWVLHAGAMVLGRVRRMPAHGSHRWFAYDGLGRELDGEIRGAYGAGFANVTSARQRVERVHDLRRYEVRIDYRASA